jgi:hypothetical protein
VDGVKRRRLPADRVKTVVCIFGKVAALLTYNVVFNMVPVFIDGFGECSLFDGQEIDLSRDSKSLVEHLVAQGFETD